MQSETREHNESKCSAAECANWITLHSFIVYFSRIIHSANGNLGWHLQRSQSSITWPQNMPWPHHVTQPVICSQWEFWSMLYTTMANLSLNLCQIGTHSKGMSMRFAEFFHQIICNVKSKETLSLSKLFGCNTSCWIVLAFHLRH